MTARLPGAWQHGLRRAWNQRGLLACLLWPLSLLFGLLVQLRQLCYRRGWRRAQGVAVPLVVVGNVVLGGTGKTPVVLALVQHWQAQGLAVGVISRGYGRRTHGCLEVTRDSHPQDVGDEPALMQRRSGAPLFVAERRIDAARALLAAYPQTQLIVSDDGLQHLALKRDLEIGVFDERGTGNGWLLPAGPLREPWPRQLDWALHTGRQAAFAGFQVQRQLELYAQRADGRCVPLSELASAAALPLLALAAIAQPESFFAMLRAQGLHLEKTVSLPDHYLFDSDMPFNYLGYSLICTEKDAVKLWPTQPQAWAVPLRCTLPEAFWQQLDQRTATLIKAAAAPDPLSSHHGHTIT